MLEYHIESYYTLLMTINLTLTLIVMLAACLCCKKKVPKNELLGLEGMVKLKNPDDMIVITTMGNSESQADLNISTISNGDSDKRASVAAHRSLPDIPVAEGDNGSELYETVADKQLMDAAQNELNKNPLTNLKKQASISQHSSISQADDVSSPYSRVKNSPHDYAKVRTAEHPYAQLNAPSTSGTAAALGSNSGQSSDPINRNSHQSDSSQNLTEAIPQAEIPAASAIAGMISASQDLPYMTPPITNQHFSGDSQDSSKGYTSISVREPLANILGQQPTKSVSRTLPLSRDVNDSHYATVSDDSDETYAAIEDPNSRMNLNSTADIYTSGSETYAQIQPMQSNAIVVSVEINAPSEMNVISNSLDLPTTSPHVHTISEASNPPSTSTNIMHNVIVSNHVRPISEHIVPVLPPVDSLRAQMHSRQASSSSNNSSSIGNIGSPKPEKRQANSPLPPTPKSNVSHQLSTTSSSSLASGRNSVISVIECGNIVEMLEPRSSGGTAPTALPEDSPQHKNHKSLSPTKDIEGMYAKVMKKNKFSRNSPSSQSNSPILARKHNDQFMNQLGVSPLDSAAAKLMESHKVTISTVGCGDVGDKIRVRSNSYGSKDHGYETIPADGLRNTIGVTIGVGGIENRKSDCYTNILQKERQLEGAKYANPSMESAASQIVITNRGEKHYETIAGPNSISNSDPGYETLLKPKQSHNIPERSGDDNGKAATDYDPNYEVLKDPKFSNDGDGIDKIDHLTASTGLSDDGYAKVIEKNRFAIDDDSTDGYSKVKGDDGDGEDAAAAGYSTIGEMKTIVSISADANHNYASILETKTMADAETESDHYAHIPDTRQSNNTPSMSTAVSELTLSCTTTPTLKTDEKVDDDCGDDTFTNRLPDLPVISSPSSVSSSLLNNSSITSSTVTTSTSTVSSRQTPSSSQYESLTGSDTDPNYESVRYINKGKENPYERLPSDFSDPQLSNSVNALTTPSNPLSTSLSMPNAISEQTRLDSDATVNYFQI